MEIRPSAQTAEREAGDSLQTAVEGGLIAGPDFGSVGGGDQRIHRFIDGKPRGLEIDLADLFTFQQRSGEARAKLGVERPEDVVGQASGRAGQFRGMRA